MPFDAHPPASLPNPRLDREGARIYLGDALALLPLLPAHSLDVLITDPPYGLAFNGQDWDDVTGFRASLPEVDTSDRVC